MLENLTISSYFHGLRGMRGTRSKIAVPAGIKSTPRARSGIVSMLADQKTVSLSGVRSVLLTFAGSAQLGADFQIGLLRVGVLFSWAEGQNLLIQPGFGG